MANTDQLTSRNNSQDTKYKILVADDYESNLAVIESIFEESAGQIYDIIYANDGVAACQQAIRHNPDLIIMDWEMPEMSGIDAIAFLKAREDTKHIPIIMTTAFSSSEHLEKALKTGASDFVRKPIDEIELLARVNSAIQIVSSYKKILAQKEEIEQKTLILESTFSEIEKKNEKIMSSINYAKRIQEALLPKVSNIKKELEDAFVLFKPKDVVSGDFYWFMKKEHLTFIAAMDCTGHGVPGAFMSMLGEAYLSQIISVMGMTDPAEILSQLNYFIRTALRQDETQNRDGMDAALCVLDNKDNVLRFAGAKNPLVYIRDKKMTIIKGDRRSIGGHKHPTHDGDFTCHTIELKEEPTAFYIFTDGYQDQFNSDMKSKFMAGRLRKLLKRVHRYPSEEQQTILTHIIEDWMRNSKQIDDILVIGFQA